MSLIRLEKRGHVAVLTLDRPDSMNALGPFMAGRAEVELLDAV